jgi:uncharacterized membrane protein YheB (UPF0754 family)
VIVLEEIIKFIVIVTIGGLIGWMTNKVAIKMLFRPVNPKKFLFFTIQGVFPKRKDIMAEKLADTIERELLSKENLLDAMFNEEAATEMKERLMEMLLNALKGRIPPVAKMFLGDNVEGTIKEYLKKHEDEIFNQLMGVIKENGMDSVNIKTIIQNRIDELDFVEFEEIIFGLMKKELKHVEIIGLFLGALIGVIQYAVSYLL